ncbi:MAG: hypothetical protein KH611_11070 [Clostridium sp.]|nr:hypothetical protein [Clostridium sp.]
MAIPSGYSLLGRIGYNDRGVYSENNEYVRGDVVYHEGSSYVALTTVTGIAPADDNTNWKYLARGFGATELSEIDATDTSGFAGDAGKKVKSQTLIDKIAEYVMSKVVATDAFQTYLQKFLVDNCVTERSDLSLSAAQGKALQDQVATLNSNLAYVDIDMSSASVNTEVSANYPTGFNRTNSIAIGIAGFDKNYSAWYGYLNDDVFFLTLGNRIVVKTTSSAYVGSGAKIRVLLMRIK